MASEIVAPSANENSVMGFSSFASSTEGTPPMFGVNHPGVGESDSSSVTGADLIQSVLEENARRMATEPGGRLRRGMKDYLNRTQDENGAGTWESVFQSRRALAMLLRSQWWMTLIVILYCTFLAVHIAWAGQRPLVSGEYSSFQHYRFKAMTLSDGALPSKPAVEDFFLLLDGCMAVDAEIDSWEDGIMLVKSFASPVPMNGWLLVMLEQEEELDPHSFWLEGSSDAREWVRVGSGVWRHDATMQLRLVEGNVEDLKLPTKAKATEGFGIDSDRVLRMDMRPHIGLVMAHFMEPCVRLTFMLLALILVARGKVWAASVTLWVSFLAASLIQFAAAVTLLAAGLPHAAVVPIVGCVYDCYAGLGLSVGVAGRRLVSMGLAAASVPLAIALQVRGLYQDEERDLWRELLHPYWVLVLMGVVGLGIKIGVFTKANRSIETDRRRYMEAWKVCLEREKGDEAVKDLTQLLATLQKGLKADSRRQYVYEKVEGGFGFGTPLAMRRPVIARMSGFSSFMSAARLGSDLFKFRKGSAGGMENQPEFLGDGEQRKVLVVSDLDQLFQQARGLDPFMQAKVWLWAIETQGMLLVRRPVAESAAQPEDDDCQESTRSHTHQPHKHTPRGGHAHGHKREEHDHKREEPQRDEWGGLRTFGRLASGVGIGRTSSAVQDAPRRTASADQGKQKTVEVYSMIGEMQPGDAIAWPKLKGQKRAIAKVAQVYKDDVSRLTDVCRHRLVFHSVRQLLTCVQRIITDKDIEIRGVKNSLVSRRRRGQKKQDPSAGYRCVMLNISICSSETACLALDLHVCELQLVLLPIAQVQLSADHHAYILFRNQRRSTRLPSALSHLCRWLGVTKHLTLAPPDGGLGWSWRKHSTSTDGRLASLLGSLTQKGGSMGSVQTTTTMNSPMHHNNGSPGFPLFSHGYMAGGGVRSSATMSESGGSGGHGDRKSVV